MHISPLSSTTSASIFRPCCSVSGYGHPVNTVPQEIGVADLVGSPRATRSPGVARSSHHHAAMRTPKG